MYLLVKKTHRLVPKCDLVLPARVPLQPGADGPHPAAIPPVQFEVDRGETLSMDAVAVSVNHLNSKAKAIMAGGGK